MDIVRQEVGAFFILRLFWCHCVCALSRSASWLTSRVAVKEFVFAHALSTQDAAARGADRPGADCPAAASQAQGADHEPAGPRDPAVARREIVEEIVGEAGIMSFLRHPRILQIYGCSLTAQAIWIVSELCSLGSLRQVPPTPRPYRHAACFAQKLIPRPWVVKVLDDRRRDLPTPVRLQMAIDVAEGMSFLHARSPPIIHRDIKSHNLFVQVRCLRYRPRVLYIHDGLNAGNSARYVCRHGNFAASLARKMQWGRGEAAT